MVNVANRSVVVGGVGIVVGVVSGVVVVGVVVGRGGGEVVIVVDIVGVQYDGVKL